MSKKWLVSIIGAAAVAVSGGALAQAGPTVPSFYVGAEVGSADVGDDDDIGFKILGGYQFHRNFAAELGYGMLFDKNDVEVTALELVGVGLWPLGNQFSLLGKLGFANVEVDSRFGSEDKTEFTWGVGFQYDLSRNLGLRGLWQRYETDEEVDWLTVGVVWRF